MSVEVEKFEDRTAAPEIEGDVSGFELHEIYRHANGSLCEG